MTVKLSPRLLMSAEMVGDSKCVADVGCDHAHTCIWLLQNNRTERALGTDVRKGPLLKAEENLELYECSDKVELRLSFGLDELKPGEADTIIIAGMGGDMIRDILERDETANRVLAQSSPTLILQPQTHSWNVRRWLDEHGYVIVAEDMVRDDDKFYPAMKAVRNEDQVLRGTKADGGDHSAAGLTDEEMYFGPILLRTKHPVLREFLEIEYRKKQYMLTQIKKSGTKEAEAKHEEVLDLFDIIRSACEICGANI